MAWGITSPKSRPRTKPPSIGRQRGFINLALLDGAPLRPSFDLPFVNTSAGACTIVPRSARGSSTTTFTRATAGNANAFAAAANTGASQLLIQAASAEARFVGGRRVSEGVWSTNYADAAAISVETLKGYLSEPAATNLCLQSRTPATANWSTTGAGVNNAQALARDGTTGMASLVSDATTGRHSAYHTTASNPTGKHSYAVDVKDKSGGLFVRVCIDSAAGANFAYITVNPRTGEITQAATNSATGNFSAVSGRVEAHPGGIYRIFLTATAAAAITYLTVALLNSGTAAEGTDFGNGSYTGVSGDGIYFDYNQWEAGDPTSPITTTTGAVGRNADKLSAVATGNINAAAGTLSLEIQDIPAAAARSAVLFDAQANAAADYIQLELQTNGLVRLLMYSGGVQQAAIASTTDCRGTTRRRITATWKANEVKLYVDGVQEGATDTSATMPADLTSMTIGCYSSAGYELGGCLQGLLIHNRVLSAAEVAAL